jgi:hypothetical protein
MDAVLHSSQHREMYTPNGGWIWGVGGKGQEDSRPIEVKSFQGRYITKKMSSKTDGGMFPAPRVINSTVSLYAVWAFFIQSSISKAINKAYFNSINFREDNVPM